MVMLSMFGCSSSSTNDGGSAGGASGGAGGGNGGGAGAGGGSVLDAGPYRVIVSNGGNAALVVALTETANITLTELDGGGVELQPDGLQLGEPGFLAMRAHSDVDAGAVAVPFFRLASSDGGVEGLDASLVLEGLAPGFAAGWAYANVPHFTTVQAGMFWFEISDVPSRWLVETEHPFSASGPPNCTTTVALTGQLARGTTGPKCVDVGSGTLSVLANCGGQHQVSIFKKTVECYVPDPPPTAAPQVDVHIQLALPPASVTGTCPNGREAACQLIERSIEAASSPVAVTTRLLLPCGVDGHNPCPVGPDLSAFLLVTAVGSDVVFQLLQARVDDVEVLTLLTLNGQPGSPVVLPFSPPLPSLPAGQTSTPIPFSFRCRKQGVTRLRLTTTANLPGKPPLTFFEPMADLQCGGEGDAVMLSDNTRLVRSGNVFNAQPTGVTANVIAATGAVAAKFGPVDEGTTGFDRIAAFTSELGWPKLQLRSGAQTGVFTHNGARYQQQGLVGAAAYGVTDTLTVTALLADGGIATKPDGGLAQHTLAAPGALPPPSTLLGPLAGLATPIRLVDGSFDVMFVSIETPSPRGGSAGLQRVVRAADMVLDGGYREAPLLDAVARAALVKWGLTPSSVYVAAYRQQSVDDLFFTADGGARAVPLQAGRMVQLTVSELSP